MHRTLLSSASSKSILYRPNRPNVVTHFNWGPLECFRTAQAKNGASAFPWFGGRDRWIRWKCPFCWSCRTLPFTDSFAVYFLCATEHDRLRRGTLTHLRQNPHIQQLFIRCRFRDFGKCAQFRLRSPNIYWNVKSWSSALWHHLPHIAKTEKSLMCTYPI